MCVKVVVCYFNDLIAIASLLLVGCYNSFGDSKVRELDSITPNTTISRLHTLYGGVSSLDVKQDLIVCGRVTATDRGGNFYRTFVVEADGMAIEILEGISNSYVRHPNGCVGGIKLKGLSMSRSRGVLQVGLKSPSYSSYPLDYLSSEVVIDKYLINMGDISLVEPYRVSIEELSQTLCGRLIIVDMTTLQT